MKLPALFVGMMCLLLATPAVAAVGSWSVDRSTDPFTDEEIVTARVTMDRYDDPYLMVRCQGTVLEVILETSDHIANAASAPVRYRLGTGDVVTSEWEVREGSKVIANAPREFALELQTRDDRAVFEVENYDGEQKRRTFSLVDAERSIQRVLDACSN